VLVAGKMPTVELPPRPWQELLRANQGEALRLEISVQGREGGWSIFEAMTNRVAQEEIDRYLVYRLLHPAYNIYGKLGIYQRDLQTYNEQPVLENESFHGGCVNCHTFRQNQPDLMALHIRYKPSGNPILLIRSNTVAQIAKTAGYLTWHPSGRLLTYSSNQFRLFYHTVGDTRDLFDASSDLGIYRVDSNALVTAACIARPDRLETWPCWSADGRTLYFCSAPKLKLERFKQVRYDLMKVAYDIDQDRWGEPETLLSARETRLSAAEPRVSPDGRWLLCCLMPYGNFPPYQAASDLYLVNLNTGQHRALEINSSQCDSWHSWSRNGRWVVFSSKRLDALFSRPYVSHVDADGRFSKPLLLPQKDPSFYDSCIQTFNLPELVQGPVPVRPVDLRRGVLKPQMVLKPLNAGPQPTADQPYEHAGGQEHSMDHTTSPADLPK
jgi:hypothetical protein